MTRPREMEDFGSLSESHCIIRVTSLIRVNKKIMFFLDDCSNGGSSQSMHCHADQSFRDGSGRLSVTHVIYSQRTSLYNTIKKSI